LGNSPSIKGEVISKKTGVKVTIGRVKDKGELLIVLMNNIVVKVFSSDVAIIAIQNVWFTDWKERVIKARGNMIKREKNLCAQAADKTSIFIAPLLLKALATDSKKALRRENNSHMMVIIPVVKICGIQALLPL